MTETIAFFPRSAVFFSPRLGKFWEILLLAQGWIPPSLPPPSPLFFVTIFFSEVKIYLTEDFQSIGDFRQEEIRPQTREQAKTRDIPPSVVRVFSAQLG